MKITSKLFTTVLCMLLAFALSACEPNFDTPEDNKSDSISQAEDTTLPNDTTDTPETDAPETDAPAATTPDSPIDDKEDVLGTIAGKRYENARIGLGLLLSDEWAFYSEEQIRAVFRKFPHDGNRQRKAFKAIDHGNTSFFG